MKTLREYIDLIEEKSIDTEDTKKLAQLVNLNSQRLDKLTSAFSNQNLDEVNWRKGLSSIAAAGALALGASGAHAAPLTNSDWSDAGYAAGQSWAISKLVNDQSSANKIQANVNFLSKAAQQQGPQLGTTFDSTYMQGVRDVQGHANDVNYLIQQQTWSTNRITELTNKILDKEPPEAQTKTPQPSQQAQAPKSGLRSNLLDKFKK